MTKTVPPALFDAGQVAKSIHLQVADFIDIGVNSLEIESLVSNAIKKANMQAAFRGYKGYPSCSCISINDTVVHGIPRDYILEKGDVISVDIGVENKGYIVDTARTYLVGSDNPKLARFIDVTKKSLTEGIKQALPGNRTGDIGHAIETYVRKNGFSIIKDLTGHGVGKTLQEPPSIPNFGHPGKGVLLKAGMILAIEPITSISPVVLHLESDGWTIVASSGVKTAHFEDTIILTNSEPVILT